MYKGQRSIRGGIEDILIPMQYFRCTSGDFENNHPWYACDMAGKDGGQEPAYFPFSAKCVAVNPNDGNAVWWQSLRKVRFADGTVDYCTMMVLHDNSLSGIYVGAEYSQGQQMAVEGNKMGTSYGKIGNHLHFEIAKGKFTKQYAKNNKGYYLPNGLPIEKCCFADGTHFLNGGDWDWKYVKDVPVSSGGDQIIKVGSKVKFNGVFRVDYIDIPSNTFASKSLTGVPKYNYHWLSSTPFTECDASGNTTNNQVFKVGDYVKNDNIYTVKDIDKKTDSALININGRDNWVFCKPLYEVSDS